MEKILASDIRIEILKEHHNISSFYSSDKDLELFLKGDALHHQHQNISVTFLWFYEQQIVSYISLLTDRITLEADLQSFFRQKNIFYKTLPALKIGRLCVDNKFLRKGLGTNMVTAAYQKAIHLNTTTAGCRFLTVDAKKGAVSFYEKLGFRILKNTNENTVMYLDLTLHQRS